MPYIEQTDLESLIPPAWVTEVLDDDSDGDEDTGRFDSIREAAEDAVNGVLSLSYSVPIATPANFPFLKHVTRYEAARICYGRRNYEEKAMPFYSTWKSAWDLLIEIGKGEQPLGPAAGSNDQLAKPRGAVITGRSKIHSTSGGNAS
jgi:hypothetical protein